MGVNLSDLFKDRSLLVIGIVVIDINTFFNKHAVFQFLLFFYFFDLVLLNFIMNWASNVALVLLNPSRPNPERREKK